MAKQTFTTGQVLTAAQMTDLQQTAMTGGAASTKTVSYVLVAADAGTRVAMNAAGSTTITVNTGLFSAGDTVSIQNIGAGVCTVTAGTATVNTSGSLVLAQYQGGILYFTSASAAIFFQFATPASGDIEGVSAGVGISGGGTSGTVTITNSMATAIDAAGDLIYGTANDTFTRLGIGTAGQVLKVNSGATAPEWGAAAASFVGCALSNSAGGQTAANTTYTAVTWSLEDYDTDGFHSTVSNTSRVTIPSGKGGKYLINAFFQWDNNATGGRNIALYKNGSKVYETIGIASAEFPTTQINTILNLVATDYIEIFAYQNSGGTRTFYPNPNVGYFTVALLGA